MNFLQKLISRGILKSIEKLALKDPVIRAKFDDLGREADELAKAIAKMKKDRKNSDLYKK